MPRSRTRRLAPRGAYWIGIAALAGMLAGAALTPWLAARLAPPTPLSTDEWSLVVPNLEVSYGVLDKKKREGSGLVDGSLYLATQGFARGDVLRPVLDEPVAKVLLALSSGSGPVQVSFPTTDLRNGASVSVSVNGWWRRGSPEVHPISDDGITEVEARAGVLYVDGVGAGSGGAGQVELVGSEPAAKIKSVGFYDVNGAIIRQHDFANREVSATDRGIGATFGVIVAVGCTLIVRGARSPVAAIPAVIAALAPLLMSFVPSYSAWAAIRERLFLTQSVPSDLRIASVAAGLGFFVLASLVGSGVLRLPERIRRDIPLGGAAAILLGVGGFASLELQGSEWLWVVPGMLFLGLPVWTAYRVNQPILSVLVRDAPAWLSVAVFGWGTGCGIAWLWRGATLLADVPMLLARNPRAGTDAAGLLLLALPFVAEISVRQTFLAAAWTPTVLRGASVDNVGGKGNSIGAFWESACRPEQSVNNLYYFGGSSTGGAFQFSGHAEWTWPARIHERLCENATVQSGFRSLNYGDSGRDSFDVATVAAPLFARTPPTVVVYYGGINDILTETSSLTRKQRAALAKNQSSVVGLVSKLSDTSRLFSGISLIFRPEEGSQTAVSAVPLADAEENLRTLAAATAAAGGHLLLVPEYAAFEMDGNMLPYWEMEARLAAELPGITLVNLYTMIPHSQRDSLLADRNHLTREGSDFVASLIAPIILQTIQNRDAQPE